MLSIDPIAVPVQARASGYIQFLGSELVSGMLHLVPSRTALVICDVWDNHWCADAFKRMCDLAPKIEAFSFVARSAGIKVIHAPSGTMCFYSNYPQRAMVRKLPEVSEPQVGQIDAPPLPIDDSDGGCSTGEPRDCLVRRQNINISIEPSDAIADSGQEFLRLSRFWDLNCFVYTGVHMNQCVLDRSFGIKRMTRWYQRCILLNDLCDCIYNPGSWPYVSLEMATEIVRNHIERHWCPTAISTEFARSLSGI